MKRLKKVSMARRYGKQGYKWSLQIDYVVILELSNEYHIKFQKNYFEVTWYYDDEYLESEVKRFIEEPLLINPYILNVSEVQIFIEKDKINVSWKVETKYGDLYANV